MVNRPSLYIYCDPDDQDLPLIDIQYQAKQYRIRPPLLPNQIHNPDQLAGKLPSLMQRIPPESHA